MARFQPMMAGALALGLVVPMPVAASDVGATPAPLPAVVASEGELILVADGSPPGAPFAGAAVVDESALASVTGKADLQLLEQIVNAQNTGTVTDNTINGNFTTGMISIDGGSFDNFNGMALMSVNTGNNVAINSSMSVNVAFQQ